MDGWTEIVCIFVAICGYLMFGNEIGQETSLIILAKSFI